MITVGMMLYGFCRGYFGRDSYSPKRVEAFDNDWIVVRNSYGCPEFAIFDNIDELKEFCYENSKPEEDDDSTF